MGRRPCCAKVGLNKGIWSVMEDEILINYIKLHGEGKWTDLPHRAGLKRCGKSCRLRWMNYLRPNIKRGNISEDEEELIIRLHRLLGNRWALIAGRLPGRTDNEIKNYWNTYLSKRVQDRESQKFGKQTNNESGHGRFMGNRSTVAEATHEVIRTRAVRCIKAAFPQPVVMEQGHGVCSVPMSNDYPPSSSHWANNADDNFLLGFNIDELLVPDILMRSDSLAHQEMGIIEHKDTANAVFQIEDIVRCASPVPSRTSVGGEHFDPNCRTFDFDALPSF